MGDTNGKNKTQKHINITEKERNNASRLRCTGDSHIGIYTRNLEQCDPIVMCPNHTGEIEETDMMQSGYTAHLSIGSGADTQEILLLLLVK